MPRVSRQYKEERRGEILDAARACFARSGFQGATLQNIFAETGLSAGCVYNYFPSKEDLVLEIAEARHVEERAALVVAEGDPITALKAISERFLEAYLRPTDDQKRRISLMTWSEALFNDAVRESVREGVGEPQAVLAGLIRRGQKDGLIRADLNHNALAWAMVAMLQGLVLQKLWNPALSAKAMQTVCTQLIESFAASAA